jgi:hypothetical protein
VQAMNDSEKINAATAPKVGESGSNRGNAGKGRRKGVPNRINRDLREMILCALDAAGGEDYLVRQASENPTAFLSLVGRVLPKEPKPQPRPQLFDAITIKLVSPQGRVIDAEPPRMRPALEHDDREAD